VVPSRRRALPNECRMAHSIIKSQLSEVTLVMLVEHARLSTVEFTVHIRTYPGTRRVEDDRIQGLVVNPPSADPRTQLSRLYR
jgi:hypothetical protein